MYIPNGRNTKLQDTPHVDSTMKTAQDKDYYTVYTNYLQGTYDTNEFLLCKET